jgi:WD40 repeat protein
VTGETGPAGSTGAGTPADDGDCLRAELLIAAGAESPLADEDAAFLPAHLQACPACRAAALDPPPGEMAGLPEVARENYVIGPEIGRGGMGRVLSARDRRVGRAVALKEMLSAHPELRLRFEREARITARLQHPGIVSVYELGCWPDGRPFYAMPILTGRTLREAMAAAAGLAERLRLLPSLIAAADAVAYAHSRRIIHRDLTPSNILLGSFGETIVIDWGIAKDLDENDAGASTGGWTSSASPALTGAGMVVGTPAYFAPEQAEGGPVDERTDVYALGAVLYELLSGRPPYHRNLAALVIDKLRAREAPEPIPPHRELPRDLVSIARRAMQHHPAARYASAAALVEDLRRYQNGQRVQAHRYRRRELAGRWLSRRVALVVTAAVALALVAAAATAGGVRVARERNRAEASTTALLVEQGRQELLAGSPGRALVYLDEAHRRGDRTAALRFMLATVRRSTDAGTPAVARVEDEMFPAAISLAFSPDSRLLAVTHQGSASIVEVPGGKTVKVLEDEGAPLQMARFTADGGRLITWGVPGTLPGGLAVWDTHTWKRSRIAGDRDVVDVDLSPDGRLALVAGGDEEGVQVWDLGGGRLVRSFAPARPGDRLIGRWLAKGRRLVTFGSLEPPTVRDLESGRVIARLPASEQELAAVAVRADGRRLATAGPAGARLWELPSGRLIADLVAGRPVRDVAFSPEGSRLLTMGGHRYVALAQLWDPEDGSAVAALGELTPRRYEGTGFDLVEFSPDGNRVATSRDGVIRMFSARTGLLLENHEEQDFADFLAFSDDGRWLAVTYRDQSVRLLDTSGSAAIATVPGRSLRLYALGASGDPVVTGNADGDVQVWDRTGRRRFAGPPGARLLAVSDDARRVLLSTPGGLELRSSAGERLLQLPGTYATSALSPDGTWILTSTGAGAVELRDAATGQRLRAFEGFRRTLRDQAFSPDGSRLYLQEEGTGRAGLWDPRDGRTIAWLDVGQGRAATFSPDGAQLVVTGERLRVWRALDATFQYELNVDQRVAVSFSRDSRYLAALGSRLIVADLRRGVPLTDMAGADLSGAAFGPDSELLLTIGREATTVVEWRSQRALARLPGDSAGRQGWSSIPADSRGPAARPLLLSADGTTLAITDGQAGVSLWRLGLETRTPAQLARLPRPFPRPWQLDPERNFARKPVNGEESPPPPSSRTNGPPDRPTRRAAAENLDFEAGSAGQPPPGWIKEPEEGPSTSTDRPHGGKHCALLKGDAALSQTIDASPYRGKLVRFRIAVRCSLRTTIWIFAAVKRTGGSKPASTLRSPSSSCSDRWEEVEVRRYVDTDGARLGFGVAVYRDGTLWVDDAKLDVMDAAAAGAPPAAEPVTAAVEGGRSAEDVLDDFTEAVGRPARPDQVLYLRTSTELTVQPGIRLGEVGMEETWVQGAHFRSRSWSPIDRSQGGCDGRACWSIWNDRSIEVIRGSAADARRLDEGPLVAWPLRAIYRQRRLVPPPPGAPAGAALECLRLSHPQLPPRTECFDRASHLRVYEEATDEHGVLYQERLSDYRRVEGLRLPCHRERLAVWDLGEGLYPVRTTEILSARAGAPLAPALFAIPAGARPKEERPGNQAAGDPIRQSQ